MTLAARCDHQRALDGSCVLFVHGMLHGVWCWPEPWLAFFQDHGLSTQVLALPGHAGSCGGQRAVRWTSLAEYADAVVNAVARCGRTPVLVGHSLGALLIQMRLRELNPPAAVLLAPAHPSAFRRVAWELFRRDPRLFLRAQFLGSPRLAIPDSQACRTWFFSETTPDSVVEKCFALLEDESQGVCLELLLRRKVVRRAPATSPVLVLGAGRDRSVPRGVVEGAAALYGVRAEFLEEMGHDLMLEPGWEQVAGRIVRWLRELGLAGRSA